MKNVIRKLGVAGFIFFFVKGLLWLTIPAAVVAFRGCERGPESANAETPAVVETINKTESE